MKLNRSLFIILISLIATSCGKMGAEIPAAKWCALLTGENFLDTELSYYRPIDEDQQEDLNCFKFGFSIQLTNIQKETRPITMDHFNETRYIPSDEVFESFGINSNRVKDEFEGVYSRLCFGQPDFKGDALWFHIITILYNGGISLKANKEFAGYPAGEDLAPVIMCHPAWNKPEGIDDPIVTYPINDRIFVDDLLGIPLNYKSVLSSDGVEFVIPMGEHKLVEEEVTFELEIPVKVVMYLTWLNNKLSDPNAPVPFREEVLHCRFTSKYGVH